MSCKALNHLHGLVHEAGGEVIAQAETPLQRAFGEHLIVVAKAIRDLEWVFNGDKEIGTEIQSLQAVVTPDALRKSYIRWADKTLREREG
jgi:hypothetical protein